MTALRAQLAKVREVCAGSMRGVLARWTAGTDEMHGPLVHECALSRKEKCCIISQTDGPHESSKE